MPFALKEQTTTTTTTKTHTHNSPEKKAKLFPNFFLPQFKTGHHLKCGFD